MIRVSWYWTLGVVPLRMSVARPGVGPAAEGFWLGGIHIFCVSWEECGERRDAPHSLDPPDNFLCPPPVVSSHPFGHEKTFDDTHSRWHQGPAEQEIEDSQAVVAQIELMQAETAEEQRQGNACRRVLP